MEKINLSTSTNITTTYAGEFAGKYIAAAILSAPTLEQGGMTIHPNVKFKQVIQRVATDDLIRNASCDFDAHIFRRILFINEAALPEDLPHAFGLLEPAFSNDRLGF